MQPPSITEVDSTINQTFDQLNLVKHEGNPVETTNLVIKLALMINVQRDYAISGLYGYNNNIIYSELH